VLSKKRSLALERQTRCRLLDDPVAALAGNSTHLQSMG